ncbi:MAG TPA: Fe(3+) ABC transporter substrate-binding protein [Gammaproteobacteria bacterium]|nr:Fe(3+) ABC transporter substrate-binding protein [Gammaproteobacteria bacterium]
MKAAFRFAVVLLGLLAGAPALAAPGEVVVYSSRNEHLIKPLFERFTADTGIKVRYVTDKEGPLMQRLRAEGANTPADVLLTVDAGNLWAASEMGLLQATDSEVLENNVPAHLRDPENRWFGLSVRARTIVYNREKVDPAALSGYAALAEPEWRGRLCLRTSKKVYNQSLVAMLLAEHGEARTEEIVRGWVRNLAAPPFASDNEVLSAIAAGQCDVGIVNTYYLGRMLRATPELPVTVFWPDQDGSGVHVNVSGAGVTKHAPNPELGRRLIEWLSSAEAQEMFAGLNLEYPANPEVPADPLIAAWGEFKPNVINVSNAGRLQAKAVMLMDRSGYR